METSAEFAQIEDGQALSLFVLDVGDALGIEQIVPATLLPAFQYVALEFRLALVGE